MGAKALESEVVDKPMLAHVGEAHLDLSDYFDPNWG